MTMDGSAVEASPGSEAEEARDQNWRLIDVELDVLSLTCRA